MEILEARKTGDAVQRQVEDLQTLQILQPLDPLQLVPPLDTDRTHLKRQVRDIHEYACIIKWLPTHRSISYTVSDSR